MSLPELPDPDTIAPKLNFGMVGPNAEGIGFYLRLEYRDETVDPPVSSYFEHRWSVPWMELDLAERSGSVDQLLIEIRARQERSFIHRIARQLQESQTRLELAGDQFVSRRTA